MKIALITGVTGQDGSFLAELLLQKGYEVHGVLRRSSVDHNERVEHIKAEKNFHLHYGDLTDSISLVNIIKQTKLCLGNLDALRDWGYAKDYVECMWLMLQQEVPEDFVIATGKQYSVRDFCNRAFQVAGIGLEWSGKGVDEKGINKANGQTVVEVSPNLFRPTDVVTLPGYPH